MFFCAGTPCNKLAGPQLDTPSRPSSSSGIQKRRPQKTYDDLVAIDIQRTELEKKKLELEIKKIEVENAKLEREIKKMDKEEEILVLQKDVLILQKKKLELEISGIITAIDNLAVCPFNK